MFELLVSRKNYGCLLFVRINRLGRPLNNAKSFSKIRKPVQRDGAYHLELFSADERWKVENLANGKEISTVPFRTQKEDYLCR